MGINLEFATLLHRLHTAGALAGGDSVIELGAQTLAVEERILAAALTGFGRKLTAYTVPAFYGVFGFTRYQAIDVSGENGSLAFDLNDDLGERHDFHQRFDLVTNLGTSEHCFNQFIVFRNIHELCAPGGLMIHALPSLGWANHGLYAYTPKFFDCLSKANGYELLDLSFTTDQRSTLTRYDLPAYRRNDARDVMLYAILRRKTAAPFRVPADSSYFDNEQGAPHPAPLPYGAGAFGGYIKGHWYYVKGRNPSLVRNATIAVRDFLRARRR